MKHDAPEHDPHNYRPCVGIVLVNKQGQVFVAKRLDSESFELEDSWQFPQGGIDGAETPEIAALRELKEETGIESVEILRTIPEWLYYDLPADLASKCWGGIYKGQRQKWFLMKFLGTDDEINIDQNIPEFCAWEWVDPSEAIKKVVPFKTAIYKQVVSYFSAWF